MCVRVREDCNEEDRYQSRTAMCMMINLPSGPCLTMMAHGSTYYTQLSAPHCHLCKGIVLIMGAGLQKKWQFHDPTQTSKNIFRLKEIKFAVITIGSLPVM